nr:formin-like protein 5 [Lolium perenne]
MSLRLIYLSPIISPSISSDLVQIRGFSVRPWSKSTNRLELFLLARHCRPCFCGTAVPAGTAGASSAALPLAPTSSTAAGHPPPLRPARSAKPRSEPPNLHAAAAPHSPGHHARSSTPSPSPRCRVSPPSAGQHPVPRLPLLARVARSAQPRPIAHSRRAHQFLPPTPWPCARRPPPRAAKPPAAANRLTRAPATTLAGPHLLHAIRSWPARAKAPPGLTTAAPRLCISSTQRVTSSLSTHAPSSFCVCKLTKPRPPIHAAVVASIPARPHRQCRPNRPGSAGLCTPAVPLVPTRQCRP